MSGDRIRKPMYAREDMGRLVKWFFGLPLIFIIYYLLSLIMPRTGSGLRVTLILNIVSYVLFLIAATVVITGFLKFPVKKMVSGNRAFSTKALLVGFVTMFCLGAGTTFLKMAINPSDFSFTLSPGWPLDFLLSLILVVLAALLEEILCRSYVAYFVNDEMATSPKQRLIYCFASAVVFTIFHFQNPEVGGKGAIYAMVFYFVMGFSLMAVTLKTGGIEGALGIHIGNNLVNAWLFSYTGTVLQTNSVFTEAHSIDPWMVVQSVVCIAASSFAVMRMRAVQSSEKTAEKL